MGGSKDIKDPGGSWPSFSRVQRYVKREKGKYHNRACESVLTDEKYLPILMKATNSSNLQFLHNALKRPLYKDPLQTRSLQTLCSCHCHRRIKTGGMGVCAPPFPEKSDFFHVKLRLKVIKSKISH